MLRRKFYFCSDQVKNKLFSAYCNNMCSLWVSYRKRCMRQFIVSYNNLFRIVRSLPMRCSASAMFASSNVDSCQARIRRSIYRDCVVDWMSRHMITYSVIHSDVHVASKLNNMWIATLHNLAVLTAISGLLGLGYLCNIYMFSPVCLYCLFYGAIAV